MRQKDTAYLTMVHATLQVLTDNETEWKTNKPMDRQVTAIRDNYAAINNVQKSSQVTSTGVTNDKENAGDAAIEQAVLLAGFTQAYALENNNMSLYERMKVSFTMLDRLPDETLTQYLYNLHQRMKNIGKPLEEFGITSTKLAELEKSIQSFEQMKSAPRLVITNRKSHNETIPELMRDLRLSFTILDKLVKTYNETNAAFVRDYYNAREIVDRGIRHTGTKKTAMENATS